MYPTQLILHRRQRKGRYQYPSSDSLLMLKRQITKLLENKDQYVIIEGTNECGWETTQRAPAWYYSGRHLEEVYWESFKGRNNWVWQREENKRNSTFLVDICENLQRPTRFAGPWGHMLTAAVLRSTSSKQKRNNI